MVRAQMVVSHQGAWIIEANPQLGDELKGGQERADKPKKVGKI